MYGKHCRLVVRVAVGLVGNVGRVRVFYKCNPTGKCARLSLSRSLSLSLCVSRVCVCVCVCVWTRMTGRKSAMRRWMNGTIFMFPNRVKKKLKNGINSWRSMLILWRCATHWSMYGKHCIHLFPSSLIYQSHWKTHFLTSFFGLSQHPPHPRILKLHNGA